jgi:2-keto-3-deoxy-L-rhamnonate aldolase RhmA
VQAVINEAIRIIRGAGLAVGITAATRATAQAQIERGARFILNTLPILLQQSSQAFLR